MAGIYKESELPEFGELPEDHDLIRDPSTPAGALLPGLFSIPAPNRETFVPSPPADTSENVNVHSLSRNNFESYRSQRFLRSEGPLLLPSTGGGIFTTLARFTVPATFAGVITGLSQWIGDSTAYQKPNGDPDDILWRIKINEVPVFDFSNLRQVISWIDKEAKMYVTIGENNVVILEATNMVAASSFFARNIPVSGILTGHWFPMDEHDDSFRNK